MTHYLDRAVNQKEHQRNKRIQKMGVSINIKSEEESKQKSWELEMGNRD